MMEIVIKRSGKVSNFIQNQRFRKKFPENALSHYPDFSIQSALKSNIFITKDRRFAVISYLGAQTRHLLMPRDPFQLSSVVTSSWRRQHTAKHFFWKKFHRYHSQIPFSVRKHRSWLDRCEQVWSWEVSKRFRNYFSKIVKITRQFKV